MNKAPDTHVWSPAGFWIRCLALFIDSLLISLILSPFTRGMPSFKDDSPILFFFLSLGVWGAWGAVGNLFFQGSLGKRICSLRIVDQYEGKQLGFFVIFFRDSIGRMVSALPLGLGYIWAAFSPEAKTLHDHIFATRVVKKTRVAVYEDQPNEDIAEPN